MLLLISDIHGEYQHLHRALEAAKPPFVRLDRPAPIPPVKDATLIIQLGDLSIGPRVITRHFYDPPLIKKPVHYMRGNHDYEPAFENVNSPTELHPNMIFIPDATVINFRGLKIGILGGADSVVDKKFRKQNTDWWPSEAVSKQAAKSLLAQGPLDILLTHMPPASLVQARLDYKPSPSAHVIENLWQDLGRPPLFCGHVHDRASFKNATVIEIFQSVLINPKDLSVHPI